MAWCWCELCQSKGHHVDKAGGDPAPHKLLLLLVVAELAEQVQAFGDILALTPELAFRFRTYWSIVARRRTQAPDVRFGRIAVGIRTALLHFRPAVDTWA